MESMLDAIKSASSFEELKLKGILPEPYSASGFFYVYFAEEDYKTALIDILQFADAGERVWYDNHLNYGDSWEEDMLMKAKNIHCCAVVLYLSENSFRSAFFWKLCRLIDQKNIPYCSVNIPREDGNIVCGEEMAKSLNLSNEDADLAHRLFNLDVTYIVGNSSFEEKRTALHRIRQNSPLIYVVEKDYVAIAGVKDLAEESIVVPEVVNLNGEDYAVRRIMPFAFANCKRLKKISLPDSIEYVGDPLLPTSDKKDNAVHAKEQYRRKKINTYNKNIPSGGVFYGCESLLDLRLPEAMKTLYFNNFIGCVSLNSLYIGDGVEKVEKGSLLEKSFLLYYAGFWFDKEWTFENFRPEGEDYNRHFPSRIRLPKLFLHRYDGEIFFPLNNSDIQKLDLPETDEIDHDFTLSGGTNINIQKKYVGQKDEFVGSRFENDVKIESLDLSECADDKMLSIFGCKKLKRIVLPEKLTQLEDMNPFGECPRLAELTLPKNLKSLNCSAFDNTLHVIISDSDHNDALFTLPKRAYQAQLEQELEQEGQKTRLGKLIWFLISPIRMFFGVCSSISRNMPLSKRKLKEMAEDDESFDEEAVGETPEEKKQRLKRLRFAITCLLAFPVMFWYLMLRRMSSHFYPFYLSEGVEKIYLKKISKKPRKLYKCTLVESDIPGYDKYIPIRASKK